MNIDSLFGFVDHLFLRSTASRVRVARHLSPHTVRLLQRAKFRVLMEHAAKHSRFYQEKFREHGIDWRKVRSHADLGDFFTTADDLRTRPIEDFLCGRPEFGFETTGTSMGVNKRVYFSYEEMKEYGRDGAVGMWNLGLRPDDVVADGFDYSFWNAPFTAYYTVEAMGSFHVIGAFVEPREFYERIRGYKPTVIMGVPTHLVRVTEVAEQEGIWPVKFLLLGGENLSERTRKYIEGVWQAKVYLSYGQTEAFGCNGIECPDKGGYHLSELSLVSEVTDTNEEGYGELTYSTLNRNVMPLLRYRSADITRWATDGECNCLLRFTPRIAKIIGRSDELINCSMGNISPYWFEEMLRDIPQITDDWQVIVRRGDRDDRIEFNMELRPGGDAEAVKEQLFKNIQERFPDCWRYYTKKFFEFDFRFHPPRTLSGGRKLRRLIDARAQAWAE
ncbi:MAG: phenylacetate--CoA ligase family protein [Acidobacteria bacterium]|nr:MAG: phenylacetate--CoA ligase family protein [Acidobacteriota bacterium]